MVIFNSYVSHNQRVSSNTTIHHDSVFDETTHRYRHCPHCPIIIIYYYPTIIM